jgi:type III secretory pathway component EscU
MARCIEKIVFTNETKTRNPYARELRDPRYRKQIVKSKKVYSRKQKHR